MAGKSSVKSGGGGSAPSSDGRSSIGNVGDPIIVDPSAIGSAGSDRDGNSDGTDTGSGTGKRKRGRPRGSGTGKSAGTKKNSSLDLDGISAILLSSHQMLSAITKIPELKIDKDESEILGRGIANVARHYDIGGASEKTLDWFNLIQALAMVYGPRVFVVAGRRKQKRAEKPAAPKSEEGGNGFDGFPAVVQMQ